MNIAYRTIIFALLSLLVTSEAISQIIVTDINENYLKGRVKQVEEFMARFNFDEDWKGNKVSDKADTALRRKHLTILFDADRFSNAKDRQLISQAKAFVDDVIAGNHTLHFEDSTWIAEVMCNVSLSGKTHSLKLILQPQLVARNEYRWVITQAHSKLFSVKTSAQGNAPMISPMEHEVGFVGLSQIKTSADCDVSRLFPSDFHQDTLSMLAVLLHNGLLSIKTVEHVSFSFFSVPGWAFTIERLEKPHSYNTGWLITRLYKMD